MSQVLTPNDGAVVQKKGRGWPGAWRWALVLIMLLGFALRLHQLDGQSMWNDEGLSAYRAQLPLNEVLANTITIDGSETVDTNPPLYFLLLHLGFKAAGNSIFALRFWGVLIALLNIPLLYQVGKLLLNRQAGLVAAFLLALSPFHVWQSQEMRNYTLLLFFNLLSVYGLLRYLFAVSGTRRRAWLILWAGAAVAGIYTHYFAVFILAFGFLALIGQGLRARKFQPSRRLLLLLLLFLLISLPILWAGFTRFRAGPQIDFVFVPIQHLLSHALTAYSVGITPGFIQPFWRVFPVLILAAAGIISFICARRRLALILLLGYLFVPLVLLFLLSAVNPLYNGPRHLFMGLPPYLLLVAAGIAGPWAADNQVGSKNGWCRFAGSWTWRVITLLLALLLVASQVQWLYTQFNSPDLVKDDIQGLAEYLNEVALPEDLIVLHDTISGVTFDYYYQGAAPWTAVPSLGEQRPEAALEQLKTAGEQGRRLWFVSEPFPRTGFPRQFLSNWAGDNWPEIMDRRFPALWLTLNLDLYAPDPLAEMPPDGVPASDANWGEELVLEGYHLPDTAAAGAPWQPVFYWSNLDADASGYDFSLRLSDEQGRIWAQIDDDLWRQYPPSAWPEGETVRYAPVLTLPAGIPPGDYQVTLRLTRKEDQAPLTSDGQVDLHLSPSLIVLPGQAAADRQMLPSHTPVDISFGREVKLVGYDLPTADYRPGHVVPIDLYWLVEQTPTADYRAQVQLLDDQEAVVAETVAPPTRDAYPTMDWQPGDLLHGQVDLYVPAAADAGLYTVRVALVDPHNGQLLSTSRLWGESSANLAPIQVVPWDLETELPAVQYPRRADFGQPPFIELHGFSLTGQDPDTTEQIIVMQPGEALDLTLHWRSLADDIPVGYTVFLHLIDEEQNIIAQGDGQPVGGFRPTTSWREGEVIADTHTILVPAETPDGDYQIWIGLFDPESGQRAPLVVAGRQLPGDHLPLAHGMIGP